MSDSKKSAVQKAQELGAFFDGVENPKQLLVAGFIGIYLAFIPATIKMAEPGGHVQTVVETLVKNVLPNGSKIPADRMIPAMAAIYSFFTYAVTSALSVAGQGMGSANGFDNAHPRAHINNLRGLPLRLRSAHLQIIEMFPGWAIAAALAQVLAPKNQQILNLLGLHMVSKICVHYPAYISNVPPLRSLAHLMATSSIVAVAYLLAMGEK